MKNIARSLSMIFTFVVALALACPVQAELNGVVTIFHAGSLSVPLAKIEKEFEAAHPAVDIQRTAGGSTKMARMISEEGKPADIMASADYTVIDNNLIPKFAQWNIRFATNQLVLCYTDKSRHADKITALYTLQGAFRTDGRDNPGFCQNLC